MTNELFLPRAAEILLKGYVDRHAARRAIRTIRRQARQRPQTQFRMNCSLVEDFCGYALADLVDLRRQLQWQGADVCLEGCSETVKARLAVPLFESLLAKQSSQLRPAHVQAD